MIAGNITYEQCLKEMPYEEYDNYIACYNSIEKEYEKKNTPRS